MVILITFLSLFIFPMNFLRFSRLVVLVSVISVSLFSFSSVSAGGEGGTVLTVATGSSMSSGVLLPGKKQKVASFVFAASNDGDIGLWSITFQKLSTAPNGLFQNLYFEQAFVGKTWTTTGGFDVSGKMTMDFKSGPFPYVDHPVIAGGTTSTFNVYTDVLPGGFGNQVFQLSIAKPGDIQTSNDFVNVSFGGASSVSGPMMILSGNPPPVSNIDLAFGTPVKSEAKNNGLYSRFTVFFGHKAPVKTYFIMRVTITSPSGNVYVARNVNIPTSYVYYSFDVLKSFVPQGSVVKIEFDPDNQILETNEQNNTNSMTMLF